MNKVIILLGPTGVGKTGASILLAKALNTEIISADSMQIYRHMDIGTAKPSRKEMAGVKHHMIDIVEPSESFSAGQYIERVIPIIEHLHTQGKIPVIVGGTGLYIRAMTRGLFSGPSADWNLREELLAMEAAHTGSLYARLKKLDPEAASRIMGADTRRIVRALEVCLKTETGITELQKNLTSPLPYPFILIGLTRERKELYELIEKRVDAMLAKGLVDEVRNLLGMNPGKTAMQAIGYKEMALFFRGEISFDEAIRIIKKRSKNYAKRQFTWFRQEEGIQWLDVTGLFTGKDIYKTIEPFAK
ncbi:MAG: tRNA (adenosine(37)-N6)-dimethylallyltransferase MiaA [Nitrospirae bacterium]|nr:tRNA (adenosine(37)-N6)-dimethylallyltransferase MiaA [Nitrospirota bacterium]MCL5420881.1 tRNA (adenosine(37)-N6)-dimethylallyltransferase MiaA [Nitrospirota bacterium]